MAPGSSAASTTCSVAGVSFGSLAERAPSNPTTAPIVRPRQPSGNPRAATSGRAPSVPANLVSAEKSAVEHAPGADHPIPEGPRRRSSGGVSHSTPRRARGRHRRRQNHPVGHRKPFRYERDDFLTHPLWIEAGVHRPNHLGKEVRPRQAAPQGRLNRPEPLGQIRTDLRHPLSARRTTGARLPTSPRQSTLRPIWNGGSF